MPIRRFSRYLYTLFWAAEMPAYMMMRAAMLAFEFQDAVYRCVIIEQKFIP